MKLEDIDGELYITESLLESLREQKTTTRDSPKYTVVVGDSQVGVLKSFKSHPPLLELDFECTIDPGSLVRKLSGSYVRVSGMDLGLSYQIGEVSCNVETLRCSVKAIHIEEVPDERREPDVRIRQVHGVDREEGASSSAESERYPSREDRR